MFKKYSPLFISIKSILVLSLFFVLGIAASVASAINLTIKIQNLTDQPMTAHYLKCVNDVCGDKIKVKLGANGKKYDSINNLSEKDKYRLQIVNAVTKDGASSSDYSPDDCMVWGRGEDKVENVVSFLINKKNPKKIDCNIWQLSGS